jgi:undecaprenyl diphosphate synthase
LTLQELRDYFAPVPADIDLGSFNPERVPQHIAVIMDGNGRWAEQRGLGRAQGHRAGIEGVRALIRTSNDLGVRYLTIYSFSTENWARPVTEIKALMNLFAKTMAAELQSLHAEGVRIRIIGDMKPLPSRTRETFLDAIRQTEHNAGMTLIIALNYGSRREIIGAAQTLALHAAAGRYTVEELESPEFCEARFVEQLDTAAIPDPDLLIRTSGEFRLSNFLLFQVAYSELYITQTLWPDFDRYELLRAVLAYQGRERRFGGA